MRGRSPLTPLQNREGFSQEGKASPTKKVKLTELGQVSTRPDTQTWLFSAGPRPLSGRPSLWDQEGEKLTANFSLWVRRCWCQRVCRTSLSFPCALGFWKTEQFHQPTTTYLSTELAAQPRPKELVQLREGPEASGQAPNCRAELFCLLAGAGRPY